MIDLTGERYGRLVVLRQAGRGANWHVKWLCRCDCGVEAVVYGNNMKRGLTRSCGCLHREFVIAASTTHGHSRESGWSPEYRTWTSMLTRCTNKACKGFPRYGGRGIKVCPRWRSFEAFLEDMGPRPSLKHSLDRINNDGDYSPENCRWATRREQGRNKSTNRRVVVGGKEMVLADACELYGISHSRVLGRIKSGWSVEAAVTMPTRKNNSTNQQGEAP